MKEWPKQINLPDKICKIDYVNREEFMEIMKARNADLFSQTKWVGAAFHDRPRILVCIENPPEYPEIKRTPEEILDTVVHEMLHIIAREYYLMNNNEQTIALVTAFIVGLLGNGKLELPSMDSIIGERSKK